MCSSSPFVGLCFIIEAAAAAGLAISQHNTRQQLHWVRFIYNLSLVANLDVNYDIFPLAFAFFSTKLQLSQNCEWTLTTGCSSSNKKLLNELKFIHAHTTLVERDFYAIDLQLPLCCHFFFARIHASCFLQLKHRSINQLIGCPKSNTPTRCTWRVCSLGKKKHKQQKEVENMWWA